MEKITGDELKNLKELKRKNYFSTGFCDIDEFLKNVEKGSIITIGARPSMGKTSFALNILMHLAEKKKTVFYFSLAMSKELITKRMLSIKAEVDPCRIASGNMQPKDWEKLEKAMEVLINYELFIEDEPTLTVDDIEEKVKNSEVKPDVVFIDYIQLLKMPKAPNYTDAINLAVQELKRIARETGIIFVLLTQLSRAVEQRLDKRPILSDIRSSSLLEELSDVVMMIYREQYYNAEDESCKHIAEIIFRKNDFGPLITASLLFDKGIFRNRQNIINF